MKFALSEEGIKIEAARGVKGFCPICKQQLIPRCGQIKGKHWAHKKNSCDPWSSPETEWHLNWKNQFPIEWQEVVCQHPEIPGKHIADIKTPKETVLEFQHSPISEEDKKSREIFYKKLFWIVDVHKKQWLKQVTKAHYELDPFGYTVCTNAIEVYPTEWLNREVFVLLDYKGIEPEKEADEFEDLICIIPTIGLKKYAYILKIPRKDFIEGIKDNSIVINLTAFKERLNSILTISDKILRGEIKLQKTVPIRTVYPRIRRHRRL